MTFRGCLPLFSKMSKFSQARNFWWVKLILMKLIYLNLALKSDSFDVTIGIEIPFFRILFTIEPGRSLLQFVTTSCLTNSKRLKCFHLSYFHKWKIIKAYNFDKLTNKIQLLFFSKAQIHKLFWSWEGKGVISLAHANFCTFWVWLGDLF